MSDLTAKIISIETDETKPAHAENLSKEPVSERAAQAPKVSTANTTKAIPNAKTGGIWTAMSLLALCWLLFVVAVFGLQYGFGLETMTILSPIQWAGVLALAMFPIFIIFICGSCLSKLATLTVQSRALSAAADAISKPDTAMEARANSLAGAVRSQILNVDSSLDASLKRLASMELTLKGHTDALENSHIAATRQTGEIAQRLSEERDGLQSISNNFDERMGALSRMMNEHGERLTQSTHIAEQKIQEARVSVEGAAAKINASSEIVRENAVQAAKSLGVTEVSISDLALKIKTQANTIDSINSSHAAEMATLVSQLKAEQEEMNATIEDRLEKMRDMSLSARVSAEKLVEASEAGRKTVQALAESASIADSAVKQRFADMEEIVEYSTAKAETVGERAAKRVRDSLSLTRMEIGRIEQDMLALERHVPSKVNSQSGPNTPIYKVTETIAPASGWRKSLLRFRPIEDDLPSAKAASAIGITSIDVSDIEDNDIEIPEIDLEQSVLRPASDLDLTRNSDTSSLGNPESDSEMSIPETSSYDLEATADLPGDFSDDLPDDLALELDVDPNPPEDASLSEFDAPITPIEDTPELRKRSKRSWSWRSMLGGIEALDPEKTDAASQDDSLDPQDLQSSDAFIIAHLKQIGLAPNAVIDDGCIIECVNTGRVKGTEAIKEVVAIRFSGPVKHLSETLEINSQLSENVAIFVARYFKTLKPYSDDREGMRSQLETETGRAFLLCDAALSNVYQI